LAGCGDVVDEQPNDTQARGIYGNDLEWDTVGWHLGFCAATTAGVIASSTWIPWVKIPGIVAAIAGGASMVVQLTKWYVCTDFRKLIDGLLNKNAQALADVIYSSELPQLAVISVATTTTGIMCYRSATGLVVRAAVISVWNKIAELLLNAIPALKTTTVNGVLIAPI
jgi:hypothetical protein